MTHNESDTHRERGVICIIWFGSLEIKYINTQLNIHAHISRNQVKVWPSVVRLTQ